MAPGSGEGLPQRGASTGSGPEPADGAPLREEGPPAPRPTRAPATSTRVLAVRDGRRAWRPDQVVTEEPLEIRAGGAHQEAVPIGVTMRTPGNDFELAVGFLLSEGLATAPEDVLAVRYCDLGPDQPQLYNVVSVTLAHPLGEEAFRRNFTATASCGVCGTATLDQLQWRCAPLPAGPVVPLSVLVGLPGALRAGQRLFERTGGLHAAGLFGVDGHLAAVREDVGRHNALDKLVGGAALRRELPLGQSLVALSGRIGYELVQKVATAGAPILVAVSAPSSLAIDTAERFGVTTVGFVRPGRANIYTHPERVDLDA